MGIVKRYDSVEVGAIFKRSEEIGGHSESMHSSGGSGKRRAVIDDTGLVGRGKEEASAWASGNQIAATVTCLNSAVGQEALAILNTENVKRVTLKIHLATQFPMGANPYMMRVAYQETFHFPSPDGFSTKGMDTLGGAHFQNVRPSHAVVVCEKKEHGTSGSAALHIVTSYPTASAPPGVGATESVWVIEK